MLLRCFTSTLVQGSVRYHSHDFSEKFNISVKKTLKSFSLYFQGLQHVCCHLSRTSYVRFRPSNTHYVTECSNFQNISYHFDMKRKYDIYLRPFNDKCPSHKSEIYILDLLGIYIGSILLSYLVGKSSIKTHWTIPSTHRYGHFLEFSHTYKMKSFATIFKSYTVEVLIT